MNRGYDIVVVGGGPAGMAAATAAARSQRSVCLVDDNPALGGQIWRGAESDPVNRQATQRFRSLIASGVHILRGTRIIDQPHSGTLTADGRDGTCQIHFDKLILATGARERFLPFPGWDLPNVIGAGGLQALVKGGLDVSGKRVVVAGSGPLLIAVAAYLRAHGANVLRVAEQASWRSLWRFSVAMLTQRAKLAEAVGYGSKLGGIPFTANCWPLRAEGQDKEKEKLEQVTLRMRDREFNVACDYLACGFFLIPNCELAALLGCEIEGGFVLVNELQQTTLPNVYCAGEPTSIGGLELSLLEGEIAGYAASGQLAKAQSLFTARDPMCRFARVLNATFALRPELKALAQAETIICRCEDVIHERLRLCGSWREAKLHTRCGMGPCQGRICGPATEFLYGWEPSSVRPPIFPTHTSTLAQGAN